jgi:hypothetical protein
MSEKQQMGGIATRSNIFPVILVDLNWDLGRTGHEFTFTLNEKTRPPLHFNLSGPISTQIFFMYNRSAPTHTHHLIKQAKLPHHEWLTTQTKRLLTKQGSHKAKI